MSTITIDSKAFKIIMDKLEFLEISMKKMSANNGFSKWMDEAEVMALTGLSKKSLQLKRRQMIFSWSSATGKKIKYLRKDVEAYLNGNATVYIKKAPARTEAIS